MSDDRVPAPLEALVRAIALGTPDEGDERAATFAKGSHYRATEKSLWPGL